MVLRHKIYEDNCIFRITPKTERRKAVFNLRSRIPSWAAGVLAAAALLPLGASAQKAGSEPSFSILRKNVGVVTQAGTRSGTVLPTDGGNGEFFISDIDGDGLPDAGVFDRDSRLFTIRRSGDGSTLALSISPLKGRPELAVADYDGDGQADPAIWQDGAWQILLSTRGYSANPAFFGIAGDVPVPADYDGDKRADLAVFRPAENRWYIQSSESGKVTTVDFGIAGSDVLLPADYTGDGKADVAVYRAGIWYLIDSETGEHDQLNFGFDDGQPVPADVDRDGTVDHVFYRKGSWYVYNGEGLVSYKFGTAEDTPLSVVQVRGSSPGR